MRRRLGANSCAADIASCFSQARAIAAEMAAEALKEQGNAAFAAREYTKAITLYTEAIMTATASEATPEPYGNLHVLYSNRTAAFLARGAPTDALSALADANAALRHNARFVKAYGRKGAALMALGNHEEAVSVLTAGVRIDPSNAALKESLTAAQAAMAAARMRQAAAASAAASATSVSASASAAPAAGKTEEVDPLAAFFDEISALSGDGNKPDSRSVGDSSRPPAAGGAGAGAGTGRLSASEPAAAAQGSGVRAGAASSAGSDSEEDDVGGADAAHPNGAASAAGVVAGVPAAVARLSPEELAAQTARLVAQDLGTTTSAIDRVMQRNHAWINLNPYDVLALPHTATDDDIKARYRKVSASATSCSATPRYEIMQYHACWAVAHWLQYYSAAVRRMTV